MDKLTQALTVLQLAETQSLEAFSAYREVACHYDDEIARLGAKITTIRNALKDDLAVRRSQSHLDKCRTRVTEALSIAKTEAIEAFNSGLTDSKKTWSQDGYAIRLTETRTPISDNPMLTLHHLEKLGALQSVVKSIKLVFNKKTATTMHDSIEDGVDGLEIKKKTTCSIKNSVKKS